MKKILSNYDDETAYRLLRDWSFRARDEQLPPPGDWLTWLFMAGRGAGKTRSGAEWCRDKIKHNHKRIALIAPTASDARDVMVEGESGILSVCHPEDTDSDGNVTGVPLYEPSKRRLTWKNGALATLYSAEEPERLRGPQHECGWCDELAAWKYARETWDMFQFGLRLGKHPQAMVTTTPKPLTLLREILADKNTVVSTGSTLANKDNLAPSFLKAILDKYQGTRLGQQEIYAHLLDEAEGALWTRDMVEKAYIPEKKFDIELKRVVVAVDPAVTSKAESAETGIVVVGLGHDHRGYLLEDFSGRHTPNEWARKTIAAFHQWNADLIIAEGNQGGELVRSNIRTAWHNAPVKLVHASRGKQARAEPVAALYEQGKCSHVGAYKELEDQLVTWEPMSGLPSPDRLDALVWGFTELMLGGSVLTPLVGRYGSH